MTELILYNTLTRQKEVFEPEDPNNVRMYVCGPTVYDFAHIGNARPVIVFDVLFRLLRHLYGEDKVTYVRNITDVDDKINARALRDYPDLPLNEAIRNVTEKTANQFHSDVKALGCLEPTHEPRATEHIEGMVAMIQTLLDKDHAYVAKGEQGREVLFRVKSMPNYGALSNRKLEDQQAGARVAVEAHKENPGDFVLWKESAEIEPGWEGTFNGETIHGRPGWHIECSVMSKAHLGETFDIHGGGLDLIFPHHENEIAQSRCAHGSDQMARYWMHNGYLQVEGKKMSKSEGNFVTIHDLLHTEKFGGRMWAGAVLRHATLMRDYREPLDFTKEALLQSFADLAIASTELKRFLGKQHSSDVETDPLWREEIHPSETIVNFLMNDLDTRSALSDLTERLKKLDPTNFEQGRQIIHDFRLLGAFDKKTLPLLSGSVSSMQWGKAPIKKVNLALSLLPKKKVAVANGNLSFASIIDSKLTELGFQLSSQDPESLNLSYIGDQSENDNVDGLVAQRLAHLNAKNFEEADKIRDELASQGIHLKDSKDSETGERVTTWEVKR